MKKHVPEFRFPGFIEEWIEKKLEEFFQIVGCGSSETDNEDYWNGNIQWFTPIEIKGTFVTKSLRTITELGLQKSSAKILPVGTILLTTRAIIGEASIALVECSTNQGFQSLIVNENNNISVGYC
ncbi:MAG: restriction endonuclease subunit S [Bacteroidota bacterium]|nr:restriction endonuclease subunit S [Bacteroidota bacterium]